MKEVASTPIQQQWVERVVWQAFSYYRPLSRVCEYVLRHLHDTVTLADAARAAHFEETYFSSYFRKRVGIPFTSWLRLRRVVRAVEILLREDISIEELAHQVGFKSLRTFEQSFKALTGTTPRAARKAMNPHMRVANSQIPARLAQILAHISQMEVL